MGRVLKAALLVSWVAAGAIAVASWLLGVVAAVFMFLNAFGNSPYSGQSSDRRGVWLLLMFLIILLAIIIFGFILPISRRRKRDLRPKP